MEDGQGALPESMQPQVVQIVMQNPEQENLPGGQLIQLDPDAGQMQYIQVF